MPELEVEIGGRGYRVACADGQEDSLRSAASALDTEAQNALAATGGAGMPEARLLLMAGLMLADRLVSGDAASVASSPAPDTGALSRVADELEQLATRLEAGAAS